MNRFASLSLVVLLRIAAQYCATLICLSTGAAAQEADKPKVCGVLVDDAIYETNLFERTMTIAMARGDIAEMQRSATSYLDGNFATCEPSEFASICDFNCHVLIGRHYLFMSSWVRYYASRGGADGNTEPLRPEALNAMANEGLNFLNERRETLLGTLPAARPASTSRLRSHLADLARFDHLRAELAMAKGDINYQAASEHRLKKLLQVATEDTGGEIALPEAARIGRSEVLTSYREAQSIVSEAVIRIPDADEFGDIRADYLQLQESLTKRQRSVEQGQMFLGIDPDQFSIFTIDKLRSELQLSTQRLRQIENEIDGLLRSWINSEAFQESQAVDERRIATNRSSTLSMYRINELEGQAAEFTREINSQLDLNTIEQGNLEFELRKREAEANLMANVFELEFRKESIQDRTDAELLDLDSVGVQRQLSAVLARVNQRTAEENLAVQISGIESQIIEYTRQQEHTQNERRRLKINIENALQQKAIADLGIEQSRERIDALDVRRDAMWENRERALVGSICQVEAELRILGGKPNVPLSGARSCDLPDLAMTEANYQELMCPGSDGEGLRTDFDNAGIATRSRVLICVLGGDIPEELRELIASDEAWECPADFSSDSRLSLAKQIFQREQAIAEKEIRSAEMQIEDIRSSARRLEIDFDASYRDQTRIRNEMTKLGTLLTAASYKPVMSQITGTSSGVATTFENQYATAQAAYATYRDFETSNLSMREYKRTFGQRAASLQASINQLQREVDIAPLRDELRRFRAERAIFEIRGQALQMSDELRAMHLEARSTAVDCERQSALQEINVTKAIARHDQLSAELSASEQGNELLDNDVRIEQSRIEEQERRKEIADLRVQELEVQIEGLDRDLALLESLIEQAAGRIDRLTNLAGELDELRTEESAQRRALESLDKTRRNAFIAAGDAELDFVDEVIEQSETRTDALNGMIDEIAKIYGDRAPLVVRLREQQTDLQLSIDEERTRLVGRIVADDDGGEKEEIYLTSQLNIAQLARGVPDNLRRKAIEAERVNLHLNALRNRVASMASLTSTGSGGELDIVYVRTADDLERVERLISDQAVWSREQVITETSRMVVPSSSGLAHELARNRRASFEISPYARGRMSELGHYSLWSGDFDPDRWGMTQNLMLIDMQLGIYFPMPGCIERRYQLRHEGAGFAFREASSLDPTLVPIFTVGAERAAISSYFTLSDRGRDRLQPILSYWARNHYLHNFMREGQGPPNDVNANMPLMGVPLIGQYELVLPDPPEGCAYEGASYELFPVYAKTVRGRR